MKHYSKIPFTIPPHLPARALCLLLVIDLLFVSLHLLCAHPEIQASLGQPMHSLNLNIEGNLPTNWAILQLYLAAICAVLMVFWYREGVRVPLFWKFAAVALFLFGFDESASIHELWSAGIFPLLFGLDPAMGGNRPTLLVYGLLLGGFYLSSLPAFATISRKAIGLFVLSGLVLIMSQADEIRLPVIMDWHHAAVGIWQGWLPGISYNNLQYAWEEGFELVCYSLIFAGVLQGAKDTQNSI